MFFELFADTGAKERGPELGSSLTTSDVWISAGAEPGILIFITCVISFRKLCDRIPPSIQIACPGHWILWLGFAEIGENYRINVWGI